MKWKLAGLLLMMSGGTALLGCVERKMLIRSDPPGAPVWVDEQCVGDTPLEYPFAHYGARRVRVGPVRDADGNVEYTEKERVALIEAPWYETFPLDFFFEVVYPGRLTDVHDLGVFELEPVGADPERHGPERVQQVLDRAEEFRKRALSSVPEEAPAD